MTDWEAKEMMQRCKHEFLSLRREIDRLRPKADAYETVAQILALLPRPSVGMSEDLVWVLDKRIKELEMKEEPKSVPPNADGISLILSEAGVKNSSYLAVKIAEAVESGKYD